MGHRESHMVELTAEEHEEMGRLVADGYTSGRIDREDGTKVAWDLRWNKWRD